MSSAAAFCEAPIFDREWVDSSEWSNDHWYDLEAATIYSASTTHGESHIRRAIPVLLNIEETFQTLAEQWSAETAYLSSIHEIVLNSAYQRIIGLGPLVVPALLHDLRERGRFWFWALTAITGENPVPEEELGDLQRMSDRWNAWAAERGLLL